MLATLRALLRTPPESSSSAKAGGHSISKNKVGRSLHIIATTSRSDAACNILHELFEETIVVPLLTEASSVEKLLSDSGYSSNAKEMSKLIIGKLERVGSKSVLRLAERARAASHMMTTSESNGEIRELEEILEDVQMDSDEAVSMCEIL